MHFPDIKFEARGFRDPLVSTFFRLLFENVACAAGVQLSVNDLFHTHLFQPGENLGFLFHAREYPAYDLETFRYDLGFCQRTSTLKRRNN